NLCKKLLPNIEELAKIIGLPIFDVSRMSFSRLVESYIINQTAQHNELIPNKPNDNAMRTRRTQTYAGGFVYQPTPGLYENVAVFDFRSLYPSIITSHNIGPESFRCSCCEGMEKVPEKPEYWFCMREKKFIPKVLEDLVVLRTKGKKEAREAKMRGEDTTVLDARSYALKVLANAFYGYLGFFGARWYGLECAASTTAYARYYIKDTIQKAREKGFEVIYSDTDSCFVLLGEKTITVAKEFMQEINQDLPGQMELELEGYYPKGIFVAIKGTEKGVEKGAKKKYALLSQEGKLKVTGFEAVRRNWSLIAKEVQENVLRLVLQDKPQEAWEYVRTMIKELKLGTVPLRKLIIKTQITKELGQYTAMGPHVAAAQRMASKGEPVLPGTVVEYVIIKGSGLVRDHVRLVEEVKEGEYDAEYYLNNQIIPAVSSIFAVLGYKEDEIFQETSQTGLEKWF
ncbi:MAG: DNA polymerase domain-containing protein, partial [Nanoarchaeota archaeon]